MITNKTNDNQQDWIIYHWNNLKKCTLHQNKIFPGPDHGQEETASIVCSLSIYAISHSHIDGLVQDCSNSSALAMELLQSCTKPSPCYRIQARPRQEGLKGES